MQRSAPTKIVLSASRRTDIPAFYMPWFMERIRAGVFEVKNPYNGRISRVPATPEDVHTIVFWSKNFGPFLRNRCGDELESMGYHLFFNFTVNSDCPELEPGVPPLEERLNQLEALCRRFSPQSVLWRFDPICVYMTTCGMKDNLKDFKTIADKAHAAGITRCITSFLDLYPKIRKRTGKKNDISFVEPSLSQQKEILLELASYLTVLGISLYTCCEKDLLASIPPEAGIRQSACIPNRLIEFLFGPGISLAGDPGQRIKAGCGCGISTDIGSYGEHPCHHNCLFCYANPADYGTAGPAVPKKGEECAE